MDFSYVNVGYELRPHRRYLRQYDLEKDINLILMMTLREYLGRRLTYDTDVLNAFSGVLNDFGRVLKSTVVMGSITRLLDWSIHFSVGSRNVERRDEFPSWTWCGWKNTPIWAEDDEILEWTGYCTWIVWYHRGREPETITGIPREVGITWSDSIEAQTKRLNISKSEDDELPFALRMCYERFKYKRTAEATPFPLPDGPLCHSNIAKNRGYLQFWTMSASLKLQYPTESGEMSLFDRDGDRCGSVHINKPLDASGDPRECEIILLSQLNWHKGVELTYIAQKRRRYKETGTSTSSNDESGVSPAVEENNLLEGSKRKIVDGKLNVMLVAWESGMAERLGIGDIWTESVNYLKEPGLVWKEFVLA